MDSLISQVPKRISKLESFLRQNEEKIGARDLRYYESCVVEIKGVLILGHLILTDESLYLTQNPPKSFSHAILLSQIHNIHLVADRRTLVTGPSTNYNHSGQHVQILFTSLKGGSVEKSQNKTSKLESEVEDGSSDWSEDTSEITDPLKLCYCLQNHPEIPLSVRAAYHPHSCRSSKTSSETSGSDRLRRPRPLPLAPSSLTGTDGVDSSSSSSKGSLSVKSQVRSSSVLEQKLFSWISRKDNFKGTADPVKRPSSVDIGQLSKFQKNRLNSKSSQKKTEKPIPKEPKEPEPVVEVVNIYLYDPTTLFLNEIFLYWNRQVLKSTLGHEVVVLEKEPERSFHAAEKIFSRLGLGLNQDEEFGNLLRSKSKQTTWELNRLLTRLCLLHQNLQRYHQLSRLCWKSPVLIRGLLRTLKACLVPGRNEEKENHAKTFDLDRILVLQLSTYLLVMDIFRLLYESCSTSSTIQPQHEEQIKTLIGGTPDEKPMEWSQVTKTLLHTIFSFPNTLNKRRLVSNEILKVNLHPQTFTKLEWTRGQNSKVIGLLAMGHNTSSALLYEILSIIHFSKRDLKRASMMKHMENYNMELYLRMSVAQIIHLLWPSPEQMISSQCALLFVHVSVLKTLLSTVPHTRKFLQLTFSEEFQYFISRKSAENKISDQYLIKEKLLVMCDELRQEIIS